MTKLKNKKKLSQSFFFYIYNSDRGRASQQEWEQRILLLSNDIMSETLLGIRLDGEAFLGWRFEVLKKTQ